MEYPDFRLMRHRSKNPIYNQVEVEYERLKSFVISRMHYSRNSDHCMVHYYQASPDMVKASKLIHDELIQLGYSVEANYECGTLAGCQDIKMKVMW